MKTFLLAVLLMAASVLSAADVTGLWVGKGGKADPKYGSIPSTFQVRLVQAGTNVSGFLIRDKGDAMKFSAGTVNGSTITFAIKENGQVMNGQLAMTGGQMTGRLASTSGEVYTFALVKQ